MRVSNNHIDAVNIMTIGKAFSLGFNIIRANANDPNIGNFN